jgi:hypothetical protein
MANDTITSFIKHSISIGLYFPNIPKYSWPFEDRNLNIPTIFIGQLLSIYAHLVLAKFQVNKLIIYFRAAILITLVF